MNEREQIITFLLTACDQKSNIIAELQKKIASLEKQLSESNPILNSSADALKKIELPKPNGKIPREAV